MSAPLTLILRHRRENLKKCSLRGLEGRSDMRFYTYPKDGLPDLRGYALLTLGAKELTEADRGLGILLIDGTWRHAATMEHSLAGCEGLVRRSLPKGWKTAYPRRQDDCSDPGAGLASVEALYAAYTVLGRDVDGLLDHYHWKEEFLYSNRLMTTPCS